MKNIIFIFLVPIIFLVAQIITLPHYGVSWDESEHFFRGQAYLHYFMTGKISYPEGQKKASYFQNDSLPTEYWLRRDTGHPPLNDILAAATNFIFYQKINVLGDIQSHQLFIIFTSALLVLVVLVFAYLAYGKVVAIISGLVLSLYPLFFGEAHFNIKDPPQSAFYALTILSIWISLRKKNARWLLLAAVFFGFSLSIKFNIVFLPFIVIPYLFFRFYPKFKVRKTPKSFIWALIFSPLVVGTIFFGSWPFLWQDPIGNLLKTVNFYLGIGTGFEPQPGYFLAGFNLYPIIWIITTTPPIVLILVFFGIIAAIKDKTREKTSLLWLFWFLIPIIRVTLPGTSIYGGVRQIMEYIPAMALIAGLGAHHLTQRYLKLESFKFLLILLTLAFLLYPIVKYHPNENVYFNFLVGGLKGASEKDIPYWGNSYGNAYKPAIDWLNKNAEPNATLALVQGTALNVPKIILRNDIDFWNGYWSGTKKKGEYLLELTYGNSRFAYPENWEYVETYLNPVYEVKVDGVTIAKLWKNDWQHSRK